MQEIKSNNEKKKKPFTRRTKPLESKAKLIRHTNFMIASKISEKKKELVHGSHSLELKFMGVKSVKEDQQMKSITP